MPAPDSFLRYRGFRWLILSVALLVGATLAYVFAQPSDARSGRTAAGLTLGIVAGVILLWLMSYGLRHRRYGGTGPTLAGWLSAHVYLGAALLLLVPLHAAFHLAANLHGFAYLLLVATVLSGAVGVIVYVRVPRAMTANRSGEKLSALCERIDQIDAECQVFARSIPAMAAVVQRSVTQTSVGGGLLRQLIASERRCPTRQALGTLTRAADDGSVAPAHANEMRKLLSLLTFKQSLLRQIRRDVQLKAMLDVWQIAHVPLASMTIAAVVVHVVVVFYYP